MAVYKPKSNVAKSSKKSPFKFKWWMAAIIVGVIALVGIVVLRFSHAGAVGYGAWKQNYTTQDSIVVPIKQTGLDIIFTETLKALVERACYGTYNGPAPTLYVKASTRHEHGMGGPFSTETPYSAKLDVNSYSSSYKYVYNQSVDLRVDYPIPAGKSLNTNSIKFRVVTGQGGWNWRSLSELPICP